jgi:hypothetical protein
MLTLLVIRHRHRLIHLIPIFRHPHLMDQCRLDQIFHQGHVQDDREVQLKIRTMTVVQTKIKNRNVEVLITPGKGQLKRIR